MIVNVLDWTGTVLILVGNFIITSKSASNPKIRMIALSSYLLSNIAWIPFAIMLQTYGLLITQILLSIMNVRGIIVCRKESKNLDKIMKW